MAREFAQIKLAIWADDDWRDLSPMARYLYLSLLTSPTLSHCGVADWRPARMGALNGMDMDEIEDAGCELVEALYIVIDHESEEVLVRSFVRNDGLMKQPKMAVAMATAHAAVASKDIRGVIVHELKRLREDFPNLSGWGPERATDLLGMRSVNPSDYPLGKGSIKGSLKGSGKGKPTPIAKGSGKGSPTPSPTPTPTDSRLTPAAMSAEETDRFDDFWDTYGKKNGRKIAEQKWKIALRKPGITADLLIASAASYVAWQKSEGKHPAFTKDPATWLNGEHWNDERPQVTEPSNVRRLPHATELELPPDGLSPAEYSKWHAEQRAKRNGGQR